MQNFNGKWNYRSFCPRTGTAESPAQIAAPWTPPGELNVTTDANGNVAGTLRFGANAELHVKGTLTPASEKDRVPEGIELNAEGLGSVYLVRGYFLAGSTHLTGTVLAIRNDLAKQPPGTLGAFILFPA